MTLTEARDLLDILIDKANNPYFTTNEKDEFLELALTEFINKYYSVNDINEQARAALKGITKFTTPTVTTGTIPVGDKVMFVLSVGVQYNLPHRVIAAHHGKLPHVQAKQVSAADFKFQSDPFNKPTKENPIYTYTVSATGGSQIHILPDRSIGDVILYFIERPELTGVFDSNDIEETYQHEVVQIAARKMLANIDRSNYEVQSQEAN